MQLIDILGERLFLDYLIVSNFNYTYSNNIIDTSIQSYCESIDINSKITDIQNLIESEQNLPEPNYNTIDTYNRGIQMLQELKTNLNL